MAQQWHANRSTSSFVRGFIPSSAADIQRKKNGLSRARNIYQLPAVKTLQKRPLRYIRSARPIDRDAVKLLHWAAQTGDSIKVQQLLDEDVPPDYKLSKQGWTPILLAAHGGFQKVLEILLKEGANPRVASDTGVAAIHLAAQGGYSEIIKLLCRSYQTKLDARMNNGWSALFFAAQNGHCRIAEYLLHKNASLDLRDEDGRTPLYFAAQEGHKEVVLILLKASADPEGHCEASEDGATPLFIASQQGHKAVVETLLDNGAKVNHQKRSGATALHIAAWDGHVDVVQTLIDHGADPMLTTRGNWTCLHCATRGGNIDTVNYLIQWEKQGLSSRKSNKVMRESIGGSSITTTCGSLNLSSLRRRLVKRAIRTARSVQTSPDQGTNNVASPLHIASGSGHLNIADMFLAQGMFDIECCMPGGATSLHIAVQEGQLSMVQLLCAYGASRESETDAGVKPMDIAVHKGFKDIVSWFKATENWKRLALSTFALDGVISLKRHMQDPSTTSLEILECANTFQHQVQLDPKLANNVKSICMSVALGWRIRNHLYFPFHQRSLVSTILYAAHRLSSTESSYCLPVELWLMILNQVNR